MAAGEVIFVIALNCIIILMLYKFQQKSLEKRMKHLKNEIQDLEDLVAAIIEEFQEIAEVTEARANDAKKAILESARVIETDEPVTKRQVNEFDNEMNEIDNPEPPAQTVTIVETPELSDDLVSEAGTTPQPSLSGKNVRPVGDGRHQRILDLWEQGMSIEEIAKKLGTGRGEVQLILGIYRRS